MDVGPRPGPEADMENIGPVMRSSVCACTLVRVCVRVIVPTLLFVPCVGYGPGGYRLGYGGGFYDRTLATLQPKPVTVGLGYSHGWLPGLEPEAHDVPLDALLNDEGVVWAG